MRRAPATIKSAPKTDFQPSASPRKIAAKIITKTKLNRSITTTLVAKPYLREKKKKSKERAPAIPERAIKSQSLEVKVLIENPSNFLRNKLTIIKKAPIIRERIVVAKVESTPFKPSLAKTATRAAVTDERKA